MGKKFESQIGLGRTGRNTVKKETGRSHYGQTKQRENQKEQKVVISKFDSRKERDRARQNREQRRDLAPKRRSEGQNLPIFLRQNKKKHVQQTSGKCLPV